ncbi:hypothetical protein AFLA_006607 [Aspergillus flavus NRRL3357]|nr:hypothetical protein AFLA_006607 [Aspergillus flavus NRRL3357]
MDFISFLHQENFKEVLETDLLQLGVSAALLGVLLHITIFRRVALLTTLFNTSLNTSISIYRLFVHRLHPFPGPFACKPTRFYSAFLAAKNIQYNVELKRLHKQYGNFVRTGPR